MYRMYIMKQGKMRKRLFIIIAIVLIGFVVIEKNIQTTNNIKIYNRVYIE